MASFGERVMRRVQHALGFGETSTRPDDTGPVQTVQVRLDSLRTIDAVPIVQQFGFSSCLPIASQVVRLTAQGDSTQGVVVGSVHQASRPRGLTPGQAILHDQIGSNILLTNGNTIVATAAAAVRLVAPSTRVTGNLEAATGWTGTFTAAGGDVVTVQDGLITNVA